MKTMIRRTAALGATAALLLTATACSADANPGGTPVAEDCTPAAEFSTIVPGTLTVAAVQQLPGIDIDVSTGTTTGLDSVVLADFAAANCLTVDFQALAGASAVAAMTEGKADVGGGGWYRTAARGEILGQTQPIWFDRVGIVAPEKISGIPDLVGKRIGIVGGSLFEAPLAEAIGVDNVISYQSMDAIFQDLAAGRIDGAMGAGATLTIQLEDRGADGLQVSQLDPDPAYEVLTAPGEPNYPYTKSNTALGEALDAFVGQAREDGSVAKSLAGFGLTDDFVMTGPAR